MYNPYRQRCKLAIGDTVLIPYEILYDPFKSDSKEKKPRKAVVHDMTDHLVVLKILPRGQIASYPYIDCEKFHILDSKFAPPQYDDRKLMETLKIR